LKIDNARVENIKSKNEKVEGFRLIGYKGSYDFYCQTPLDLDNWITKLKKTCVLSDISTYYTFGKMLGKGSFAKVHLAQQKPNNKMVAIKTIEKEKILGDPRSVQSLYREITIMRVLNHPNVMKLYEVYENDTYIHLVLEYLKGGELFQRLKSKGRYSEEVAALVLKSLLEAIKYCHSLNIIHRDLKPENLIFEYNSINMFSDSYTNTTMKIADFGLATMYNPDMEETLKCGSLGYVAPEILLDKGYGPKVDVFSAGVIFCIMLTGVSPFYDKTHEGTLERNKKGVIDFNEICWNLVSKEAKSLAARMVVKDPYKRCTAEEALKDPWFSIEHNDLIELTNTQDSMRKYSNENRFNLGKIKPGFGTVTYTPLLDTCSLGQELPLFIPLNSKKRQDDKGFVYESKTPNSRPKALNIFPKKPKLMRHKEKVLDDSCDFSEKEIDEKWKPHLVRVSPPTSGFTKKQLALNKNYATTPILNKKIIRNKTSRNKEFLQKIVNKKFNEEAKILAKDYIRSSEKFLKNNLHKYNNDTEKEFNVPISEMVAELVTKRLIESPTESISSSSRIVRVQYEKNIQ